MPSLREYLVKYSDIPGYFTKEAMIAWDFLLDAQGKMSRKPGHFLEIGVYKGKSAVLAAHYVSRDEKLVLIDVNPCEEGLQRVKEVVNSAPIFIQQPSHLALRQNLVVELCGNYRFIHIDGNHSAYDVAADLHFAVGALREDGIICVDDFFNPIYPQVTAAVYSFMFANPLGIKMILCGAAKCFLIKPSMYSRYETLIRKYFLGHAAAFDGRFSLHKSTFAHDFGCFSIWTENDRHAWGIKFDESDRKLVGLDSNQHDVPF